MLVNLQSAANPPLEIRAIIAVLRDLMADRAPPDRSRRLRGRGGGGRRCRRAWLAFCRGFSTLQVSAAALSLFSFVILLAHKQSIVQKDSIVVRTMIIRRYRFNFYLALVLTSALAIGCQSTDRKEKKILSTLRLHLEMNPDPTGRSETADVYRESPVRFTIDKVPFLSEANVKQAKVIDVTGGFALEIQFDRQGSWLLEQYTAKPSRHIVIMSQFAPPGEDKLNKGRWLAAPLVRNHITDGLFSFTPDATREEADRIALGLNNVARRLATGQDVNWK